MGTIPVHTSESANGATTRSGRGRFLTQLLFVLFCLEVGFVLFLMPWTNLWDSNYFFSITPQLNHFWLSAYLRGAVSGVGLINLWIGFCEAWHMKRHSHRPS